MDIAEKDIKMLWGRAAGRCSAPGCLTECTPFLSNLSPTVIGEMAHVISRSKKGPRGKSGTGDNTYNNLILLCPTDHTRVDKAPEGIYTKEILLEWKTKHEKRIDESFQSIKYQNTNDLFQHISFLLFENKTALDTYGPNSPIAMDDPLSSAVHIWIFRKLSQIVPNNRQIINAIQSNRNLFRIDQYKIALLFIEHAEGFEKNCYERTPGVPKFPITFAKMVNENAI